MRFTDDCYTDRRVPSVLFSPTDFIAVTDGMSPSVKLDNVVVSHPLFSRRHSLFSLCLISFHLLTSSNVYMLCICPSFFHLFPLLHFLSFYILLSSIIILFSHLFVFKIRKSPIWGKLRFMRVLNFIWIYDMKILLKYFF